MTGVMPDPEPVGPTGEAPDAEVPKEAEGTGGMSC